MLEPKTNITEAHKHAFNELVSGASGYALFSCFVDGKPSAVIVRVTADKKKMYYIEPLFVAVTPEEG